MASGVASLYRLRWSSIVRSRLVSDCREPGIASFSLCKLEKMHKCALMIGRKPKAGFAAHHYTSVLKPTISGIPGQDPLFSIALITGPATHAEVPPPLLPLFRRIIRSLAGRLPTKDEKQPITLASCHTRCDQHAWIGVV